MLWYKHFTLDERKYLQELLSQGYSIRKIAGFLGRSPSSVSREIRRNRTRKQPKNKPNNRYWYHHWRAQILYTVRRKECGKSRRTLKPGTFVYWYVVEGLKRFWSPEQIAHRLPIDYPGLSISTSTIYRHLKAGDLQEVSRKKNLRRKNKQIRLRNPACMTIHPDRIIPDWPDEIRKRLRIGDWEGDTVYGGIGKGLLVTLVDRKTRFLCAAVIRSRNAAETRQAIVYLLNKLPCLSISLDNGSEFSEFQLLEKELQTSVYFAEPHKPWQRGTNENTNDILRFFYPKGYDFRTLSQQALQNVVDLINSRPRKCLGWKSPAEIFFDSSVALT